MQSDKIRTEHWRMYVGGELVGLLHLATPDQAWSTCTFEPLEGWEAVRPLFDVQNDAAKEGFPADKGWATKEIRDRGVELRPLESEAAPVIEPFMIYVDGDQARFRP
ncbi:hypothetical protein ACFV30_31020 [Streptomyces sp. NPDC059752]|uniref:hypothetical protein n=1 Tax=unclassified Streptomyces TaxID=2593676 RepID=UPI003659B42A